MEFRTCEPDKKRYAVTERAKEIGLEDHNVSKQSSVGLWSYITDRECFPVLYHCGFNIITARRYHFGVNRSPPC